MAEVTTSAADMLSREIREQILRGDLAPGAVLRQEDLAGRYNVSRVPLREAFSKLEAEGFLHYRPRRGYAVTSLAPEEISEIFDLRQLVEGHAGAVATRNLSPQLLEHLQSLTERMREMEQKGALREWADLNRDFHEQLFSACRRPRLQRLVQQLRDMVEPYLRIELAVTGQAEEAGRDHEEIVAACRNGDAELVGQLCAEHCQRTAQRLQDALAERGAVEA